MFWSLLLLPVVVAYNYDWARLHQCKTGDELIDTVNDYHENFPCLDCREHFQSLLSMHPFPLELVQSPADVRVWTWFTHNLVNKRLDKAWEPFDVMDTYK
tara:strand:- start:10317 stop:10616 length:300 start_codon:yes stop_codon:yes gene_type:complete